MEALKALLEPGSAHPESGPCSPSPPCPPSLSSFPEREGVGLRQHVPTQGSLTILGHMPVKVFNISSFVFLGVMIPTCPFHRRKPVRQESGSCLLHPCCVSRALNTAQDTVSAS